MPEYRKLIIYTLCAVLVISNGAWYMHTRKKTLAQSAYTASSKDYPFLSPRIFNENRNDILINFTPLRKQLEEKFKSIGADTEQSFYFEYLPSGTSIRIGSDTELIAASLIKVPLVMNLYKAAELGKLELDKAIPITESQIDDGYGDLWKQGAGTKITLREAARLALKDSDNTAAHMVFDNVNGLLPEADQSLAQLDIDQNLQDGHAIINARSYTSVLKSLYLSSYVQRDSSQEILQYLSESSEAERLTKLLPKNIKVAHKNGAYDIKRAERDCGIVYASKRPYTICIMLGLPQSQADTFMAEVSKAVYDYVIAQP